MVLAHVAKGQVFIDIGAHIGTFTVPIARRLGPHGRTLAIEGSAETYTLLVRNVAANRLAHKIKTVCAIMGEGLQQRLRRVEVKDNSGGGHYLPDPTSEIGAVDALSLIISEGFADPDFIKIDVEGMEARILRTIAPIFDRCRPGLYVEIAPDLLARHGDSVAGLDAFLRSFGYRFYRNTGQRNSSNNRFVKTELATLEEGGNFFDLLALPD
jgi:FkbM family methyltransferase